MEQTRAARVLHQPGLLLTCGGAGAETSAATPDPETGHLNWSAGSRWRYMLACRRIAADIYLKD